MSHLYTTVWHGPKGRLTDRISAACEALPRRQQLTVVALLLSAFVLMAFFAFGHACYEMGAGHARPAIEIEHLRQPELPINSTNHEIPR